MTPEDQTPLYFRLFTEIGIINQLATTLLESRLPDGLLAPHFGVLNHLVRVRDGGTPLELARAFQVPKTTMTHQIGVLERKGLVVLAPNADDGRSKRVWLTDEGRAVRERTVLAFGDVFARLAEITPHGDVAELLPRLERIRRHLDEARSQDSQRPQDTPPTND